MTTLVWDKVDERDYELGVDRGVLYDPNHTNGVAWNGLTSVDEIRFGSSFAALNYDDIKYLDTVTTSDFRAVIRAFTMPIEFSPCLGTPEAGPGLFLTRQPRTSFGLSYRTQKSAGGYKIHLVYNATVSPSSDLNETIQDGLDPKEFQWTIDTTPDYNSEYRPTAHFVIDSDRVTPESIRELEDILYGQGSYRLIDGGPPPDAPRNGLNGGTPSDVPDAVVIDGGSPFSQLSDIITAPTLPPVSEIMSLLEEV